MGRSMIMRVAEMGREIAPGETLLELDDVHMHFGKIAALVGVSLDVKKGEIHSIIGPNGAGKTVMMNCINSFGAWPVPSGIRVRAKISSQNWRPDLGRIWLRRLSKTTGIVALFRGYCD
jgi:ABC-type branched-subunit amino acid transport system ATPase component